MRLALGVQELQTLVVCAAIVANLLEKLESIARQLGLTGDGLCEQLQN